MTNIVHTEDYRPRRRNEYPDLGDQLDELWRLLSVLDPNGLADNPVYQKVLAVKDKFPKPAPGTPMAPVYKRTRGEP